MDPTAVFRIILKDEASRVEGIDINVMRSTWESLMVRYCVCGGSAHIHLSAANMDGEFYNGIADDR